MAEQHITCPECSHKIALNEALSHQVEAELAEKAKVLEAKEKEMDVVLEERLKKEKLKMWEKAQEAARKEADLELKDLKAQNEENSKKLEEAQKKELDFRKRTRDLEQKEKNIELELQKKLEQESKKLEVEIRKQADEAHRMKDLEKDKKMEMMKKHIEDLKRQSEQGSMQIQGEAQETDLKQLLQNTFLQDSIDDVPTGARGADLVQTVHDQFGNKAGIIVWESKNTKTWSSDWVKKLKDDRALVQGDLCILISQAMPDGIETFGLIDGVWVVDYTAAISLATVLRFHLINLGQAKLSSEGKDQKMDILYEYLTGSQFKNNIDGIVSAFISMQNELEREKRSMKTIWKRRQKEIERVVNNTTALYGDIKGIFGASLPQVAELELLEEGELPEPEEAEKVQDLFTE